MLNYVLDQYMNYSYKIGIQQFYFLTIKIMLRDSDVRGTEWVQI